VNIAARLASEARAGRDPLRPLVETGAAVILCSLTTMIGYGVLMLADTGAIRSFGAAAVLGEIACVSAALGVVALVMLGSWSGRANARTT
jgi:predicted RND superfamily exporter protein